MPLHHCQLALDRHLLCCHRVSWCGGVANCSRLAGALRGRVVPSLLGMPLAWMVKPGLSFLGGSPSAGRAFVSDSAVPFPAPKSMTLCTLLLSQSSLAWAALSLSPYGLLALGSASAPSPSYAASSSAPVTVSDAKKSVLGLSSCAPVENDGARSPL